MSRYFNSFMDDYSEALEHSWGTSPKAKAREKEYNHWYYQKHKDEIAAIRKQRHEATNSYKQAEKSYSDVNRYKELSDQMDARLHGWKMGPRTKTSENDGYSRNVTPIYEWGGLDQDENRREYYQDYRYNGSKARHLTKSANSRLENAKTTYQNKAYESLRRGNNLTSHGDWQIAKAKDGAKKVHQDLKNPTAKDLAEFYLDTKVIPTTGKVANKAKKYATKAVSNAEKAAKKAKKFAVKSATKAMPTIEKASNKAKKYATKTVSNAEKYATKAIPTIEKTSNKAKKYATKGMSTAEKYATKAASNAEKASNKAKKYATKTIKSAANKAKKYAVR